MSMKTKNFAAFILTHNRPDRVYTYETLRRSGYTGRIILVLDDLDESRFEYTKRYPGEIEIFNKALVAKDTDSGDNFGTLRGVLYARNASFEIAKRLGIKYFVQLDDDYRRFQFRFDNRLNYKPKVAKDLNTVFDAIIAFLEVSGAHSVAMAQGGDFIGGDGNAWAQEIRLKRKAMNSFFCSTERPFKFYGRINEDVTAYTGPASTGKLFFTTNQLSLEQIQTQSNAGGLTEIYLDLGTYVKSFYSVIFFPSGVKVKVLKDRVASRLHHSVSWRNTTPMILREDYKK